MLLFNCLANMGDADFQTSQVWRKWGDIEVRELRMVWKRRLDTLTIEELLMKISNRLGLNQRCLLIAIGLATLFLFGLCSPCIGSGPESGDASPREIPAGISLDAASGACGRHSRITHPSERQLSALPRRSALSLSRAWAGDGTWKVPPKQAPIQSVHGGPKMRATFWTAPRAAG